jgi:hypothetical protein
MARPSRRSLAKTIRRTGFGSGGSVLLPLGRRSSFRPRAAPAGSAQTSASGSALLSVGESFWEARHDTSGTGMRLEWQSLRRPQCPAPSDFQAEAYELFIGPTIRGLLRSSRGVETLKSICESLNHLWITPLSLRSQRRPERRTARRPLGFRAQRRRAVSIRDLQSAKGKL